MLQLGFNLREEDLEHQAGILTIAALVLEDGSINVDPMTVRVIQFLHSYPSQRRVLHSENLTIPHLGRMMIPADWKEIKLMRFQEPKRQPKMLKEPEIQRIPVMKTRMKPDNGAVPFQAPRPNLNRRVA